MNICMSLFIVCLLMSTNAFAANWYVDASAGGQNNGTSWSNAWQSFSKIVWGSGGVKAGDVLYISGGTTSQTYAETMTVGASGSSDSARITIRIGQEEGKNGTVIITGSAGIVSNSKHYITIDGEVNRQRRLHVYNGVGLNGANHFLLRYAEIEKADIGIDARYGIGGRISNCYIHDIREEAGITFAARNYGVASYNQTHIDHTTIVLNRTADGSGTGPDGIQGCWGMTVESSTLTNIVGVVTGAQHQDLIQMQANYITIRGNTFIGAADAAIDYDAWNGQPNNHQIYNNVFILIRGSGIRYYASGGTSLTSLQNIFISNNTFVDHTSRHQWAISATNFNGNPTLSNVFIKNNIFHNCVDPVYVSSSSGFTEADWNFDYNLVSAGVDGTTRVTLNGNSYTQSHPRTGTPQFIGYSRNSESSNLHLSESDIAAKDQGVSLSAYYVIDKDGNARPQGSYWDIGAYEHNPTLIRKMNNINAIGVRFN